MIPGWIESYEGWCWRSLNHTGSLGQGGTGIYVKLLCSRDRKGRGRCVDKRGKEEGEEGDERTGRAKHDQQARREGGEESDRERRGGEKREDAPGTVSFVGGKFSFGSREKVSRREMAKDGLDEGGEEGGGGKRAKERLLVRNERDREELVYERRGGRMRERRRKEDGGEMENRREGEEERMGRICC
ncbi:hypothetical protein BJ684DRAFT_16008 [Piptocephalis cylindrospora]|uniref:Uncharacterized protein n=1 Tax=Piptocephalis cylindrospora TaxID=1907219 RepID=A0A4P9Y447_9FUNG|nr:hypothetical protein BJ684DRAFT_16008 [Piptocephalis cylindrospora]|eukprot:RKP13613.1 hypothetical protein BJ684DRAFT_16008 [Piptocephalis cylindrospora]